MYDNINYKKMMEQEPDFDNYVRQVLVDIMLSNPNIQDVLAMINAFYQSGSSAEQTAQTLRNINREYNI